MPDQRKGDLCVEPSMWYKSLTCQTGFTIKYKLFTMVPKALPELVTVYTCSLMLNHSPPTSANWHAFSGLNSMLFFCLGDFALAVPSS